MSSCATCSDGTCFGRGVGLDDLQGSLQTPANSAILCFCDSMLKAVLGGMSSCYFFWLVAITEAFSYCPMEISIMRQCETSVL